MARIICPFCFQSFEDSEVCFRAETYFTEDRLDPEGEGQNRIHIETNMPDGPQKTARLQEYEKRARFLLKDDSHYQKFWEDFGSTTEKPESGGLAGWQRPIIRPDSHDMMRGGYRRDGDGFVYSAVDAFGRETIRRVCPHCHNPLPQNYGKHPVRFISVIGITGAGKTVYLSKLVEGLVDYIAKVGCVAIMDGASQREFLQSYPVRMGCPLPAGTQPSRLTQPLFYQIISTKPGRRKNDPPVRETNTFVLYDIAGENCVDELAMQRFGIFVEKSDGLILLLDPSQFPILGVQPQRGAQDDIASRRPDIVLQNLYRVVAGRHADSAVSVPLAVCVSKSDEFADYPGLPDCVFEQVTRAPDGSSFNTEEHRPIHQFLDRFFRENSPALYGHVTQLYENYRFFLFSAMGCKMKSITDPNGREIQTPSRPPVAKRIEEPLLWLLYQFGFTEQPHRDGFFRRLFGGGRS